jgi:hypothetical protein
MKAYKKGFLTIIDNALIYIDDNVAKTIFVIPDLIEDDRTHISVTVCGTIILSCKNNEYEVVYCLKHGHPRYIPKGDFPKAMYHEYNDRVLATFYDKIIKFNTDYVDCVIFGSCIAIIGSEFMYVYALQPREPIKNTFLPSLGIKWKDDLVSYDDEQLIHIIFTQKNVEVRLSNDSLFYKVGTCVFCFYDFNILFVNRHANTNKLFIGAEFDGPNLSRISWIKPSTQKYRTYDIINGVDIEDEAVLIVRTNKTLHLRDLDEKLEYTHAEHKFCLEKDYKIHDFIDIHNGLIVLVSRKINSEPEEPEEPEGPEEVEFKIQYQSNVVIVCSRDWDYQDVINYNGGILQRSGNGWYFISMKDQFEICFNDDGRTDVRPSERIGTTIHDDGQRPSEKKSTLGDFYDDDNFWFYDFVEVNACVFARRYYDDDGNLPKLQKLKSVSFDTPIQLEPVKMKLSLIRTKNGFNLFDGHEFTGFHEKINLDLKKLSHEQFELLDAEMFFKNRDNLDIVSNLIDKINLMLTNKSISRSYNPLKKPFSDAIIGFVEGERYLETALMACTVNRHNSRLNFALAGSTGPGPVKVVANTIIDEFVTKYFRFDGFFLVPTTVFKTEFEFFHFTMGNLLHNILHVTKTPIGYHLPLALLCGLINRKPHIVELEFYAKLADHQTYDILNSSSQADLQEAGYNSRYEWLCMLCRYAEDDIILYKKFVEGFVTFCGPESYPLHNANLVSADYFISGSYDVDISTFASKLMSKIDHDKYFEQFVCRLVSATKSEIKNFVFNLTGTYHLTGQEDIRFDDNLDQVDYKFIVCSNLLVISSGVQMENFDLLIDELFRPLQAKMVN